MAVHVTDLRFTPAGLQQSGLLGYLSFRVGDLKVDGVTLRRTTSGRLALSYPAKRDHWGRDHTYVRPSDDSTRREIEQQVLEALRISQTDSLSKSHGARNST